ncbi:granulin a isoform X2 [Denticeps clupeoides]|uniref:granulin a isoform X2 n=1 Tax=Denticeps clupeoides TaxID=299321 RepID=UPI0010A49160|nr:progranulin-like isoform X2 [Denticeps clupeoides]
MLRLALWQSLLVLGVTATKWPDHVACEAGRTCCQTASGEYSCCAHPQSLPVISAGSDGGVVCPDNSHCPAEFSCVKLPKAYGCCPVTLGVACGDLNHCCPDGHECSPDGRSCLPKTGMDVPCNSTASCPDGTTCCKTKSGDWACCPYPEAVCCDDHEHCCPKGTTCDLQKDTCDGGNGHIPMLVKIPANKKYEGAHSGMDVPCNSTASCPDGTTCCKTKSGDWACCPFPEAVCCDDHEHCCPKGTTCDLQKDTCDGGNGHIPMLVKIPANKKYEGAHSGMDVPCNSTASCPDGTTCCKTKSGDWACCPYPEAVCCDDHEHCCPKGTTCDLQKDTCDGGNGHIPMLVKIPANKKYEGAHSGMDVPCNSTASCPDGTTCCKTKSGDWACCPYPEAVCCDDHEHCCPKGTTCDLQQGTCDGSRGLMPQIKLLLTRAQVLHLENSKRTLTVGSSDVKCDTTTSCLHDNTCCFMVGETKWGCCHFPNAVCCNDGQHCCPAGHTCAEDGTCTPSTRRSRGTWRLFSKKKSQLYL